MIKYYGVHGDFTSINLAFNKLSKEYVHRVASVIGLVKSEGKVIAYKNELHRRYFMTNYGLKHYFKKVNKSTKTDDDWKT